MWKASCTNSSPLPVFQSGLMACITKSRTSSNDHVLVKKARQGKVKLGELLDFIFPHSLQHPLSTGRLYAFGMFGPLDENGKLRAGQNGRRVVSAWEIDTMCLQFEREDILQVGDITLR